MNDMQTLGRPIARGMEAEVYPWGEDRVLRLLVPGHGSRERLEHEAEVARVVAAAGYPAPQVFEIVEVEGRLGMVLERVAGADMLADVAKRPWTVYSVGVETARLHAQLGGVRAPENFPSVRARLSNVIASGGDLVPPGVAGRALGILDLLPDGDRVIHGDFHPGNILGPRGGRSVIDWNGFRGDPLADFTLSIVLMRVALPPDAPRIIQLLEKPGRKALIAGYTRTYRRLRAITDGKAEARWLSVNAAARLTEGVAGERAALLRLWDQAVRQT